MLCLGVFAAAQKPMDTPTCADLHLVPAVRECSDVKQLSASGGIEVSTEKDKEDQFTAEDLRQTAAIGGKQLASSGRNLIVYLERAGSPIAKAQLERANLSFSPEMHDEGYVIVPVGVRGLAVIAQTSAGLFYGAQTVKQLIRGSGKDAVLLAPTIRDWPAMAHRGISDDWSRGPLPNMEFLKREIRTLAAFKYNTFSPYFEHTFAYASTPVAALLTTMSSRSNRSRIAVKASATLSGLPTSA